MTGERQTGAPFAETERQAAELTAMRRMLLASRGTFSLSVAICNSPALRDYLIERVRSGEENIEVVILPDRTEDVYAYVDEIARDASPSALFVVSLEKLLPSSADKDADSLVLRRLNGTRELWKQSYACPVVFWVPEYVATLMSSRARDLWAWRSHQFEFVAEPVEALVEAAGSFAGDLLAASNLDADRKRFRIAELEQRIAEAGDPPPPELAQHVYTWVYELGYLLYAVGELYQSERRLRNLLEIDEKRGNIVGVAASLNVLGLVYKVRGDLDKAEEMLRKALEIDKKLGRLQGMADDYGNLATIYSARGDLDQAEEMHRKALAIDEKLGRLEGMANQYGNLGLIYLTRGDLDKGEEMFCKSLAIDEKLGRLDNIATTYGNLGLIYQMRGDLDKAEEMHHKSLPINEKLGRLEGMASNYGNLGVIYWTRGDLDKAEEMHRKSLKIDEKLGRLKGMATQYGNLGAIYRKRGDLRQARELWTKARDLFAKIGMPHMVGKVQGWIDKLPSP